MQEPSDAIRVKVAFVIAGRTVDQSPVFVHLLEPTHFALTPDSTIAGLPIAKLGIPPHTGEPDSHTMSLILKHRTDLKPIAPGQITAIESARIIR